MTPVWEGFLYGVSSRRYTNARLLYFGDTCHVPYGEKSPEQLETYFWEIVGFFQTQDAKV